MREEKKNEKKKLKKAVTSSCHDLFIILIKSFDCVETQTKQKH